MNPNNIRNFILIDEKLATGGQPTEADLQQLALEGWEIDINLGLLGQPYSLADEADLSETLGFQYHHIPVDYQAPTLQDLERFFALMDAHRQERVFVHCAANYRATVFTALYGQSRLGWDAEQADLFIRQIWEPNEVWAAFLDKARTTLPSTPKP